MKKPININDREYFYEVRISEGEFQDFAYTVFFIKGASTQKRVVKRKFVLFGSIIKDEVVEVENFYPVFELGLNLNKGSIVDPNIIKKEEEKYFRKLLITDEKIKI